MVMLTELWFIDIIRIYFGVLSLLYAFFVVLGTLLDPANNLLFLPPSIENIAIIFQNVHNSIGFWLSSSEYSFGVITTVVFLFFLLYSGKIGPSWIDKTFQGFSWKKVGVSLLLFLEIVLLMSLFSYALIFQWIGWKSYA